MAQFHKLLINNIQKATDNAIAISFSIPDELKSVFTFKAGQYVTLKATINGNEIRRDYSICSSPKSGNLTIAVKAVSDGTFSNYANSQLQINDTLDVAPPNGRFIYEPQSTSSKIIVAFAAGSGITPIMSILKTVLEDELNSNFILVYGNKTPSETIFLDELLALQNTHHNRFDIQFVYSQSNVTDALFGRIDKSTLNFILKNKLKNAKADAFYICGPEAMAHTVIDTLKENKIDETHIFYELFTTTAPKNAPNNIAVKEGNSIITVTLDDEKTTFTMSQKQSVLEAVLDKDLDAPYSCQGGICSTCMAKLTHGKATMRQNNILTDSEIAEGLILTCQAHPTTSTITIDYDDV